LVGVENFQPLPNSLAPWLDLPMISEATEMIADQLRIPNPGLCISVVAGEIDI
jgi:hypothetical protein